MEGTKIQWAHHTFNPWWGCDEVGPECDNCYAREFSHRLGMKLWGAGAPRRTFPEAHWRAPLKWSRAAAAAGERHRVFCASMGDVLEDRRDLDPLRDRLWGLIEDTPNLDWLLLSKRPSKFATLTPARWRQAGRANVWAGTSAGAQRTFDVLVPQLLKAAAWARVRFVSAEPLLEAVDFRLGGMALPDYAPHRPLPSLDWIIVGGESGRRARPLDAAWARFAVQQCKAAGVAAFVKQFGARSYDGDSLGSERYDFLLKDRKGGDPTEWPEDLRVREFPKVAA